MTRLDPKYPPAEEADDPAPGRYDDDNPYIMRYPAPLPASAKAFAVHLAYIDALWRSKKPWDLTLVQAIRVLKAAGSISAAGPPAKYGALPQTTIRRMMFTQAFDPKRKSGD